jgi:hypothetical protein
MLAAHLEGEAENSGYRVTESSERVGLVTARRQYHRVVPGQPQTFTSRSRTSVELVPIGRLGSLLFHI